MNHSVFELVGLADGWASVDKNRLAVTDGEVALTYSELQQAVADRADAMKCFHSVTLVEINADRTIDVIISVIAALDSGIPFEIVEFDDSTSWRPATDRSWPSFIGPVTDPAYVMSTSGSSGAAKRTLINRKGLQAVFTGLRQQWSQTIPDGALWTQLHPLTFGYAICEILGCLMLKGTLHVVPRETPLTFSQIVDKVRAGASVVSCFTPSELNLYFNSHADALPSHIILSGEPVHRVSFDVMAYLSETNKITVINTYATTETSGQITSHIIAPDQWSLVRKGYVGEVLPGIEVRILDEEDDPIAHNDHESVGKIVVVGSSVSAGYLNNQALHLKKFGQLSEECYRTGDRGRWASNNGLMVLGREARTVKLGEVWVDLDDIERELLSRNYVSETVAFQDEASNRDGSVHTQLCIVCVLRQGINPEHVRGTIIAMMPKPIPFQIVVRESLKKLSNGKLDLATICKNVPCNRNASIQMKVLSAWERIFGDGIHLDTDVFAAGLDSRGVTVFICELEQLTGKTLPARLVFDNPIIRDQIQQLSTNSQRLKAQFPGRLRKPSTRVERAALRRSARQS